jgi:hypothetical protein
MDNLPDWAVSVIALLERPEVALQSPREPLHQGRAAVAAPPG